MMLQTHILVNEMSNRIDNLENTIQDLMQTGIDEGTPAEVKR